MFCAGIVNKFAGIVNGQKSPDSSMKRAIFDDFGDLKGIIGKKGAKSVATIEKSSRKLIQRRKHLLGYPERSRRILQSSPLIRKTTMQFCQSSPLFGETTLMINE